MRTYGYAATSHDEPLTPFAFDRRDLRANDVAVEILYSGVCHTDLHIARNDWGLTQYPWCWGTRLSGASSPSAAQ